MDSSSVTRTVRTYNVYRGTSPSSTSRIEMRTKELEDAVDLERDSRVRSDRLCNELQFLLESANDQLSEQTGSTSAQMEMNKKRESEILRLRKEIEAVNSQLEVSEISMRKRHQGALADLSDQLEHSGKSKNRVEKEKNALVVELDSMSGHMDGLAKAKLSAESKADGLDEHVRRLRAQVADLTKQLGESNSIRARVTQENFDLQHQVQELDSANAGLAKAKNQLSLQVDDLKRNLDDETRQRSNLTVQLSALQADYDNLNARLEDESEISSSLRLQLSKVNADYSTLKTKYDREVIAKAEELEECKRKFSTRIIELEDNLEQSRSKILNLEKSKNRLQIELKDITIELENTQIIVQDLTKKNRQYEIDNGLLQKRVDELIEENRSLGAEAKQLAADVQKLRVSNAELHEKNEALGRENKALSDALRDAKEQVRDLTRQVNDLSALRAALEAERDSLAAALRDTEDALKDAENKLAQSQAALLQLKTDMENRLREKDEELDALRKNSQRAIEELQRTIVDIESKYKIELSRLKKKYETEIRELEASLDNATRANAEYSKQVKSLQIRVKDLEVLLDDERRAAEEARQSLAIAERKRLCAVTELEDIRTLLENSERTRKAAEIELGEQSSRCSELTIMVTSLTNDKRRMETDIGAMQSDLDESLNGQRAAEDRAERLQVEVNRLADELRQEQENYKNADSLRKQLEVEIREITIKLEDAQDFAQKEAKRIFAKIQNRLRDVEGELEAEQRRHRETNAIMRKYERQYKELFQQSDDAARANAELQGLVDQCTLKLKVYKRQVEESEDIANIAMNKYRKSQTMIDEADTRADHAEKNLQSIRRSRSVSVVRDTNTKIIRIQ